MRLKDKVAIITHGSRGIGFATAERFLQEGAKVIITASSEENAKKSAARLKELYPDSVVDGISPNLSSLESVRKEFKKVTEKIRLRGYPGEQCRSLRKARPLRNTRKRHTTVSWI